MVVVSFILARGGATRRHTLERYRGHLTQRLVTIHALLKLSFQNAPKMRGYLLSSRCQAGQGRCKADVAFGTEGAQLGLDVVGYIEAVDEGLDRFEGGRGATR